MSDKPTPDEVLAKWVNPGPGTSITYGELAEALREAVRQRDEARQRVESVGDKLATAFQERDGAARQLEAAHRRLGKVEVERDEARNLYAAQSELLAKAFQERDEAHAELASWTRDGLKGKLAIAAERDRMQDERDEWYRGCREAERQRDEEHRDLADAVIRCGQLKKERDSARQELAGARSALDLAEAVCKEADRTFMGVEDRCPYIPPSRVTESHYFAKALEAWRNVRKFGGWGMKLTIQGPGIVVWLGGVLPWLVGLWSMVVHLWHWALN